MTSLLSGHGLANRWEDCNVLGDFFCAFWERFDRKRERDQISRSLIRAGTEIEEEGITIFNCIPLV